MRPLGSLLVAAALLSSGVSAAQEFTFLPAGDLPAGSGTGQTDTTIYAPTMLFPMAQLPAFANSQVYGNGGGLGPGGGQCDAVNYSYPWRDNYCESRSWDMPLCPSGTGHQGQDIRPATCDKDVHAVVAAENGTITNIGSFSVYVTADDGTRFDYLHMSNVAVSLGQEVQKGDTLGMVSNEFGGTPTTIHLHFNIRQFVNGVGTVYVPTYMSLVNSYQNLFDRPITGALEAVGCDAVVGWAFDPDDAENAVTVPLSFDDAGVAHDVVADVYRDDLCENLSFCDHGFDVPPPFSLFDSAAHAVDAGGLPGGPLSMQCEPPELSGARRPLSQAAHTNLGLTAFWDEPPVDEADVEALPTGDAFSETLQLWRVDGDYFVVDDVLDVRRAIDARGISAWRLDKRDATVHEAADMAEGDAFPARPLLVRDAAGDLFLVDVDEPSTSGPSSSSASSGGGSALDPPGEDASSGCGCAVPGRRGVGTAGLWLAGLGAVIARRRRRRR